MSRRPVRTAVAALALSVSLLAACGDDDTDADAAADPIVVEQSPAAAATGSGPSGASLDEAMSTMSLDTRAGAMASAVGAERYEVDGDTVHLYVADDASANVGTCIGASAVLEEGESVVIHGPGVEETC